jgi:4-alpha-glucanotransferase
MDLLNSPTGRQWKKLGVKPRHGIVLPLSALRTTESSGIGEFYDLLPMIDWCREVGMNVIQLLPLNDSGSDPAPYNALSSCALNPVYLSLHALPAVKTTPDAKELNELQRVAYKEVQSLKLNFLRDYYAHGGKHLVETPEFASFIEKNSWVVPYALFKVLKEKLEHNPWTSWPEELKIPNYKALLEKYHHEMLFYMVLQYLCHVQLVHVKHYANQSDILLQGDIPILVSDDSVDVWLQPEIFDMNVSAGAPPDAFNAEGQYWNFPIFNWDNVKKENYDWWKVRLGAADKYYDLYRIDHVVGFFRIWAVPLHKPAKEGKFVPENPALWLPQGKEILEMMLATSEMLPIAEDLGQIPPSVRACLLEMGICGTKVVRWERKYEDGGGFIPYAEYPAVSMTTVSTHDSETLQLWWQEFPEDAKAFAAFKNWTYSPDLTQAQRLEMLSDAHHTPSLFHINLLQEYLALFPELVWPNPADERINIPGKILPTNWTYRFRLSVEEIISHVKLKQAIKQIISYDSPL